MQSTQVPVVVYENGVRHEVGTATVNVEGKHLAIIADALPIFEGWDLPANLEVSFNAFDEKKWNLNEYALLRDVPPVGSVPQGLIDLDGSDDA